MYTLTVHPWSVGVARRTCIYIYKTLIKRKSTVYVGLIISMLRMKRIVPFLDYDRLGCFQSCYKILYKHWPVTSIHQYYCIRQCYICLAVSMCNLLFVINKFLHFCSIHLCFYIMKPCQLNSNHFIKGIRPWSHGLQWF